MRKIVLLFLCLLFFPILSFAQETAKEKLWLVRVEDGSEIIGKILSENTKSIRLETEVFGVMNIPQNRVVWVRELRGNEIPRRVASQNAYFSHYFASQSAYNLHRGEGYYQNAMLVYNKVTFALSNKSSIGIHVLPMSLWGDVTPAWLDLKFGIPLEKNKLNLAVGAYGGLVLGEETNFLLPYAALTFGRKERNWTLGIGYGFTNWTGEVSFAKMPALSFSGLYQIRDNFYFITENYIGNIESRSKGISSIGFRWMLRRISLDFGAFSPLEAHGEFVFIPWGSVTVPFGGAVR